MAEAAAVSRREAAVMYRVGENAITAAIHSGALAAKMHNRQYRIRVDDLAAWFENLPDA